MRHPTLVRPPKPSGGRKKKPWAATVALIGTASLLALTTGTAGDDGHPSAARSRVAVSTTAPPPTEAAPRPASDPGAVAGAVDPGPFVGTWHVHTVALVIGTDGTGTASWPTHTWCDAPSSGPPTACDRLVPVDGGEQIVAGGRAQMGLTAVAGATARAIVEGSTDPSLLPDGAVTLTLAPDDVLTVSSAVGQLALCGAEASNLTVEQQNGQGINCGA